MRASKNNLKETCPNCKDGPEAYRMYFDLFKFDVDLARKLVSDGRKPVELEPDDVRYAVEWSHICAEHVAHVDTQFPGIVAHYWYTETDGIKLHGTVLIDGHHRAARTLELNAPFFVHVLTEEESLQVTVRAPLTEARDENGSSERETIQFAQEVTHWLQAVEQKLESFEIVERLCGRTPLVFRLKDPEVVGIVERVLSPLMDPSIVSIEDLPCPTLDFHYLYSDLLVAEVTHSFIDHGKCHINDDIGSSGGYRYSYGNGNTIVLDPREGVAIHFNLLSRRFHFVHSSRTRWPSIQFGDLVYEPLLRSAQMHGGVICHAGAVTTDRGAILIVGFSGDGKSTLVSGLMRSGATFVANERTIVKKVADGFNAFAFCDWVQLGLGTVMQDPSLARLLPFPDNITLPQRRFDYGRIDRYAHADWPGLSDKIALLSDEFSRYLDAPPPQSGVPIVGIIQPKVSHKPMDARIAPISKPDLRNLLSENASASAFYPDWMRWNVPKPELDVDSLAMLPALCVEFHFSNGQIQGLTNGLNEIYDALAMEHESNAKVAKPSFDPAEYPANC